MHLHRSALSVSTLLFVACSSRSPVESGPPAMASSGKDGGSEQRISLDVIPNGAAWDGDAGRLVIADFKGNRLATWSDAAGLARISHHG